MKNWYSILAGATVLFVGVHFPASAESADDITLSIASVGESNDVDKRGSSRRIIEFKDSAGKVLATHVVSQRDGEYGRCYVERLGVQFRTADIDCDYLPQQIATIAKKSGREVEVLLNSRSRLITVISPSETKMVVGNSKVPAKIRIQNVQNSIGQIVSSANCDNAETVRKEGQSIFADNPKMDESAKTTVRNQMDGLRKLCPLSDAAAGGNSGANPVKR